MKKQNLFTLKRIVLALALAGYTMSSAYAVLTSGTGTIQGAAPVLSAPSNSANNAVDFEHNAQTAGFISSGDTITLKYNYDDTDGDQDDSLSHVEWYYTRNGTQVLIAATNVVNTPATTIGGLGTSVVTIPAVAIGASEISVKIKEYSKTGDPIEGQEIVVTDVHNGGGGTGPFPPSGPVIAGDNVTPGIYASTDTSFSTNLLASANSGVKLNVGDTYVFKLWDNNGVGTIDLTDTVPNYNWRLLGTSATDSVTAPADGFDTGVTGANYTIPVNSGANGGTAITGSQDGVQGFQLAVDY